MMIGGLSAYSKISHEKTRANVMEFLLVRFQIMRVVVPRTLCDGSSNNDEI